MSTQIPNQFTQFALTPKEQLAGQQLTTLNLQVLQNILSELSIERVNLKYTPNEHFQWIQVEAELQGKIGIVAYLIECHTQAVSTTADSEIEHISDEPNPNYTGVIFE